MTVNQWLVSASRQLVDNGISTARLDALVLLEDITGKERAWVLAHPEYKILENQVKKLDNLIKRRASHEPLAYIRGKTEFYGREFYINKNVLEPRPESETMIDMLKSQKASLLKVRPFTDEENADFMIVDVGTGSGALAITAKLELPKSKVFAIDIDEKCLGTARENASKLSADVIFHQGYLLEPLAQLVEPKSVLLCNLPYVPDNFQINPAAMNEPRLAIFGGPDGLDVYRKLFKQIDNLDIKPSLILTESMPPQHKELAKIAKTGGYQLTETSDFIQAFKS